MLMLRENIELFQKCVISFKINVSKKALAIYMWKVFNRTLYSSLDRIVRKKCHQNSQLGPVKKKV